MKDKEKQSPIAHQVMPRRAGDSLQNHIEETKDGALDFFVLAAFGLALALTEWLGFLTNLPRKPWIITSIALILVCYAGYRYYKFKRQVVPYKLGRDGEMWVGHLLEGLRSKGWVPVHDVPCEHNGSKFNIDHILVGPKGVFAVETKTWSKNKHGKNIIGYKNGWLTCSGSPKDFGEIKQALASAKFTEQILKQRTGRSYSVSPILTFPCWQVDKEATARIKSEHGVFLLSSKAILSYFDEFPNVLEAGIIAEISQVLIAYAHDQALKEDL
jgi:hypothetical protein